MKDGDASDFKNQHLPATSNVSQENVIHTASDKDEKQCVESEGIVKRKCNRGGGWAWEQSFCWRWWGCGLCFWGHCWWDMPARWWRSWAMRSTESWEAGLPLLSLLIFPTHTLSSIKKKKKKSCLGTGKMLQRKKMKNKRCHSANFFFNVWHKTDMGFQWIQKNQLYFPCNLLFFLPDSAEVESRHLVSYE